MQSCASAAKLRSGGPILPIGMKAKGLVGNPPPRTVIGIPSQAYRTGPKLSGYPQRPPIIVPDAKRRRPVQRPATRTATERSVACVPRPRSWACEHRERSPCELDTTALRRSPSGPLEIATPIAPCLAELDHCRNGLTLSPGVFYVENSIHESPSQLRSQADVDRERLCRRNHAVIGRRVGDGVGNHLWVEISTEGCEFAIEQIVHDAIELHLLAELI